MGNCELLQRNITKEFYLRRVSFLLFSIQKVSSLENRSSNNLYINAILEQKAPSLVPVNQKVVSLDKQLSKTIYFKGKNAQKVASLNVNVTTYPSTLTNLTWTHYLWFIPINYENERILSREHKLI